MIVVYNENGYALKFDYDCSYVPLVGEDVTINKNTYQVVERKLNLDENEVIVNLKQ